MKFRLGFVSNSSSASFIIKKKYLSEYQIESIINHIDVSRLKGFYKDEEDPYRNSWSIYEELNENREEIIRGYTHIDNFPMDEFLTNVLHIDEAHVEFTYY